MKLDISNGIPSFTMEDFKIICNNHNVNYGDFNEIIKIIPQEPKENQRYITIILNWLANNVAMPVIIEYLQQYIIKLTNKTLKKINISQYTNFNDFKKIIDKK